MKSLPAVSLAAACIVGMSVHADAVGETRRLVVCADPNNLPFSNKALRGFENKIVALVARDLRATPRYVWWAQRRGYVRSTLNESKCDLWPGIATGTDRVASTRPYYRSTYVFVSREWSPLAGLTLDDARLRTAVIGVQMIGNDSTNSPPAHAIASRGMTDNVRGFMLYGDYRRTNPPAAIIDAVAGKEVDVALVWGPTAGYFASRSRVPLRVEPVTPAAKPWPMSFNISMGVRRGNDTLVNQVNAALDREHDAILRILASYHVPLESLTSAAHSAMPDSPRDPSG